MTLVFIWLFFDPEDLCKNCFRQFNPPPPTHVNSSHRWHAWISISHGCSMGQLASTWIPGSRISLQNIVLQWYDECYSLWPAVSFNVATHQCTNICKWIRFLRCVCLLRKKCAAWIHWKHSEDKSSLHSWKWESVCHCCWTWVQSSRTRD